MVIKGYFSIILHKNTSCGYSLESLGEAILMSTIAAARRF